MKQLYSMTNVKPEQYKKKLDNYLAISILLVCIVPFTIAFFKGVKSPEANTASIIALPILFLIFISYIITAIYLSYKSSKFYNEQHKNIQAGDTLEYNGKDCEVVDIDGDDVTIKLKVNKDSLYTKEN